MDRRLYLFFTSLLLVFSIMTIFFWIQVYKVRMENGSLGPIAEAKTTMKMSTADAVQKIKEKYPGATIVVAAARDHRVWFVELRETEGCAKLSFVDLRGGNFQTTDLPGCPAVSLGESYPYYISYCLFTRCYNFHTLFVTDLRTMEKRAVHVMDEPGLTTVAECIDGNYGIECRADISYDHDLLKIALFKDSGEGDTVVHNNGQPIRVDEVDLPGLFTSGG